MQALRRPCLIYVSVPSSSHHLKACTLSRAQWENTHSAPSQLSRHKSFQSGLIFLQVVVVVYIRNIPHSLRYLNMWSPVTSTVWGHLEDATLLEKVCHQRWALGAQVFLLLSVCIFCFVFTVKMWCLIFLLQMSCLPIIIGSPTETKNLNTHFLL